MRVAALATAFVAVAASASSLSAGTLENPEPAERLVLETEGRRLYRIACRACHGTEGDGNGPIARELDPRPRDFRYSEFKIRSTPSGEIASGRDLFDVITKGMPGTTMPDWPQLTERERWSLVHYLRTFDEYALEEPPAPRIDTRDRVRSSAESIAEGRKVYDELQCAQCHGETGRGDGPSAPELKDSSERTLRSTDLTQGWTYKGGTSPDEIYLRLLSGMDGAAMPSFAASFILEESVVEIGQRIDYGQDVTAEEREIHGAAMAEIRTKLWHLANYMASLAKPESRLHAWFLGDTEVTK